MAKLPPFTDEDLDPQVVEALKRLEAAKDNYAHAVAALDAQFLKPLNLTGSAAQADAVRAMF